MSVIVHDRVDEQVLILAFSTNVFGEHLPRSPVTFPVSVIGGREVQAGVCNWELLPCSKENVSLARRRRQFGVLFSFGHSSSLLGQNMPSLSCIITSGRSHWCRKRTRGVQTDRKSVV